MKRSKFQLRPVRKNSLSFLQLRNSIKRQGLLQPILVRPVGDDLEIVDGAHRHEACLDLGIEPEYVVREMSDEQVLAAQVAANTQRVETLNSELAKRLWRMARTTPITTIASGMGKSQSWVKQVCYLERLKPVVLQAYDRGDITFRQAVLLARIPRKYQEECLTLPESELQLVVRRLKYQGYRPDRPELSYSYRPITRVVAEIEQPTEAAQVILNETDSSPLEVWKAALRWATQMDADSKLRRNRC